MKRKFLSGLLVLCMVVSLLPVTARAAVNKQGILMNGSDWVLEDTGVLTISNTGNSTMPDFGGGSDPPWFTERSQITEVVIEDGITSVGNLAFYMCENLTSISLPDSVTSIGNLAFQFCRNLSSIKFPDGLETIGDSAFWECINLTSVEFPSSVKSIDNNAFLRCTRLKNVKFSDSAASISIGASAFEGCTSLESITLPKNLTAIKTSTFAGCSILSSVTIPDSVTTIDDMAFQECRNLTNIEIPGSVTSIGEQAFTSCTSLTSITIPNSVTSIGRLAFSNCYGLTSVVISEKVTSIEESTFSGCNALKTVVIPRSVTSIGSRAFNIVENIENVYYGSGQDDWEKVSRTDAFNSNEDPNVCYIPTVTPAPGGIDYSTGTPTLVFTSDTPFDTILEVAFNTYITFDPRGTGLELVSATVGTSTRAVSNNTLTLTFTGGGTAGDVGISFGQDAFAVDVWTANADGTRDFRSSIYDVRVSAPTETPTEPPSETPSETPSSSDDSDDDNTPAVTPTTPSVPQVVEVEKTVETGEPTPTVISGQGESDMQYIVKEDPHVNWIDRVQLPKYALNLYEVLCIGGDYDKLYDILIKDDYFTLRASRPGAGSGKAQVESVLTLVSDLRDSYASGDGGTFQSSAFTGAFDVIDTTAGDKSVSYGSLQEGDVVRTANYNAIYVTSVRKSDNPNFDADLKAATTYASTSFQAFDRDHPEVFWLSGKSKLRMVTVTMKQGSSTYKETYIFFVLADSEGFTVRDASFPNQTAIESGIQRRDQAVSAILGTVTGTTTHEKVTQLNRWLTEHNHYNTSTDLYNLPNAPHECLSALEGNIGTDGPVCDGYARAFKVLCDKLEIPCVLVDGYALTQAGGSGEFHMWNSVEMPDEQWYGVDVTWNDPTVKGVEDAKSGREREDFLLVGADTVVLGLKFSESHPPKNRAADGGVSFINGPTLSAAAFNPLAGASVLPFTDVAGNSVFYKSIEYVYDRGLMLGTSETAFSPDRSLTRAMTWTILARLAGEDTAGGTPWYSKAQSWISGKGISDGSSPDATVTRQQLAAMLWRYAGCPASDGSLAGFTDSGAVSSYAVDALRWAVEQGIVSGKSDGTLQPEGNASRAHMAAMIERFCKKYDNLSV